MMMPANFSAIAENEMTYVVGGGVEVGNIIAAGPISTFTSNIMTIVGNSFMQHWLGNTLGIMFGGHWGQADYVKDINEQSDDYGKKTIRNTMIGNLGNELSYLTHTGYDDGVGFRGVVNAGMHIVGGLMAVAQLCVVDAVPVLSDDPMYF